jgi:hypothetical protein
MDIIKQSTGNVVLTDSSGNIQKVLEFIVEKIIKI